MRIVIFSLAVLAMSTGYASACTNMQQNAAVDQIIADVANPPATPKLPQSTKKGG